MPSGSPRGKPTFFGFYGAGPQDSVGFAGDGRGGGGGEGGGEGWS